MPRRHQGAPVGGACSLRSCAVSPAFCADSLTDESADLPFMPRRTAGLSVSCTPHHASSGPTMGHMTTHTQGDFLTISQAAEFAGRDRKTIYRWLTAGRLTRYTVGMMPRVSRAELEDVITPTPDR